MQTTPLLEALAKLRSTYEKPITDMAIIRQTLSNQSSRIGMIEMPPILNENQRQLFLGNIDGLTDFLNSEDGADAIELLMNTFMAYVQARQEANRPRPPEEVE